MRQVGGVDVEGSAFLPESEEVLCLYIRPKPQGAGRQGGMSQNRLLRDIHSLWLRET